MTKKSSNNQHLQEQIWNNAECMSRLMEIISEALPHTYGNIGSLRSEWIKIAKQIDEEHE